MRFLELSPLMMMILACSLGILPVKLESQNQMSKSAKKSYRQKRIKRLRRQPIGRSLQKSKNKMKDTKSSSRKKKTLKSEKPSSRGSRPRTAMTSKTSKISRPLNASRELRRMAADKCKVWPSKQLQMRLRDSLTKMFRIRLTKSKLMSITLYRQKSNLRSEKARKLTIWLMKLYLRLKNAFI